MELLQFMLLRGANLFAGRSAAVGAVGLSEDEHAYASTHARALADDVRASYPALRLDADACGADDALAPARLLGAVAACLMNLGDGGALAPIAPRVAPGARCFFFGATFVDDRVASRLPLAFVLVNERLAALMSGEARLAANVEALASFASYAQKQTIGANSREVIRAAEARGVPWFRFRHGQSEALTQLGWGHRFRRNAASRGPATSFIACRVSHSKAATASALARVSLPVPRQAVVTTVEAAVDACSQVGFPVVVKPLLGSGGRGVSVGLETHEEVRAAARSAFRGDKSVVVESYIRGDDHRLLVIGGELRAAAKRLPPSVVGNGRSTVRELMDELNRDPRRGDSALMHPIHVDVHVERVLAKQRVKWETVLEAGRRIMLRGTANLAGGGTAIDVTDVVHPDNRALAVRAAHQIGLDIAGIDFITTDITKSWREVGGAICEINDWPSIGVHVVADSKTERDYSGMILDAMFPPGQDGRIPLIGVVGADAQAMAAAIGERLAQGEIAAGVVTNAGLTVAGSPVGESGEPHVEQVARCLEDPWCEIAVVAISDPDIATGGLGYDRASVAVIGAPAPGVIDARAVQARAARRVVADGLDPSALQVCASHPASEVDLVVPTKDHAQVGDHLARGGAVYFAEADELIRLDARGATPVAPIRPDASQQEVLAAVAAAHALAEFRERDAAWRAWTPPSYISRPR
jgi:cyanophycin synthetase